MPLIERKDFADGSTIGIWEVLENEAELLRLYPADEGELKLMHSFTHPYRRSQFLATRALLHSLVPNGKIVYDENGKPFLQSVLQSHMSVSHTGNLIAIQIAGFACGIDMERVRPKIERIAAKFLSEEELPEAIQEPATDRLYVYWCVKEAIYKVYGKKNVSLRTNIFVNKIDNPVEGYSVAVLKHEGQILERKLRYERFRDCMLAWTVNTVE